MAATGSFNSLSHLWHWGAVHVWACFIALLKANGETAAEQATWKGSRVAARPPVDTDRKVEVGK